MPIKLREINVTPNPTVDIAVQNVHADSPIVRAIDHTVLFIEPDTVVQDHNDGPSEGRSQNLNAPPQWHEDGRVSDPIFPQYGYDRNCHRISDYLREKVVPRTAWKPYEDLPLGLCLYRHDMHKDNEASNHSGIETHVQDAVIRTTNNTVYREVRAMGGPRGFLCQSSHEDFLRYHKHLIDTVLADLRQLRAQVDAVLSPTRSLADELPEIQRIIQERTSREDDEIMSAYPRLSRLFPGPPS
ncbi:hypothetical protein N0V83_010030 [Neocucurbitaria cava]|uniref:Uncharacterized protein n=1 Tax=Neocucurbitaria cava TaxID=798079 RepID=A0A9W8XZ39_9PLEO|nr:hypothetical protein N0V83_010030 [Neocucurbitaria cava]